MQTEHPLFEKISTPGMVTAITLGLYLSSLYSYLLFHSLVEIVTITVAFTLFILTVNTRRYFTNSSLQLLGVGYGLIAVIDLLHTLAYKGMNIFPGFGANLPTQLWIVARYLQAITLVTATFFVTRKADYRAILAGYAATVALLVAMIYSGNFPDCFIEGQGLTPFKVGSEYVISAILLLSLYLFYGKRQYFNAQVFSLLSTSIVCTLLSEISFTAYVSVYGFANLVGHFAKLAAFCLLYRAILVTGLREPYDLIFRDLQQKEAALRDAHDSLEEKVKERTAELQTSEARLAEAQRIARIGNWEWDIPQNRLWWSDETCRLFDLPPGKSTADFDAFINAVHPEDRKRVQRSITAALQNNAGAWQIDYRTLLSDGTVRYLHEEAETRFDPEGRPVQRVGTVQDVTERTLAEEAVRKSGEILRKREEQLNESQRVGQVGGWDWDAVNDVIWWSDEYYRIYGFELGTPPPNYEEHKKAYTQESADRLDAAVKLAMESGEPYELDLELASPTPTTRWIMARCEVKRDENGSIVGLRGTAHNITGRKEAEEEAQRNLAQQKALLELYLDRAAAGVPEIISLVVEKCVSLTGSSIGFVGFVSDDEQRMEAQIWSEKAMGNCPLEQPITFQLSEAGLWAEPIRQRRVIIVNDYRAPNPFKKGCPEGHLELVRFMGIPILDNGRVVAVAAVANSRKDYFEADQYTISLLLRGMWEIIKRKRAEEGLRRLNEELEGRVKERTVELATKNAELERMNRLFVDRELRMVELKKKIRELEERSGK